MSKYQDIKLKPYGAVYDADPFDVESEYTTSNNMRFNDTVAQKTGGEIEAILTTEKAYFLQFNGDHQAPKWFYMGDSTIRQTDFSTDTDLDVGNAVSLGTIWDSSLFNNIPVFNNTVDPPWTWLGTGDVSPLPAFPANTLCQAIRPYKSFLVALNVDDGVIEGNSRVLWSDSSDAGALPASWDIADPTTLAGDAYLTSSKGEIVDGLQLRDMFAIYKTHAIYIMRLVSGQSVMRFEKIQINSGLLAKNCVQEFKGIHFVVADGDVVVFDGQSIKSVADKRVRATIFGGMDTINYRNSYVTRYDRQDEMWLCYPTPGFVYPNKAAIWNWKDDTWTFRDLSEARHIASGLATLGGFTYDDPIAAVTYDDPTMLIPYSPVSDNPTTDTLVSATQTRIGSELSTDVSFNTPSLWTLSNATVSGGQLTLSSNSSGTIDTTLEAFVSKTYIVEIDIESITGGGVSATIGGFVLTPKITTSGTYFYTVSPAAQTIGLFSDVGDGGIINSCSFKIDSDPALNILDESFDFVGSVLTSTLEKLSMDFGNEDIKIVNAVIPRITATSGTKVYIRVGVQLNPTDSIQWDTEQLYTVGVDRKAYFTAKGRYISVRFRTQDASTNWKLHNFSLVMAQSGSY